jgi:hypothetical protein
VRVAVESGRIQAHGEQHLVEAGFEAGRGTFAMDGEGFGEDLADAHARVEGGVGVLEDDLHAAAKVTELAGAGGAEVLPGEADIAGCGFDQAEQHAGDGALAGAGFADQAKGLAATDGEGDAVDDAAGGGSVDVLLD